MASWAFRAVSHLLWGAPRLEVSFELRGVAYVSRRAVTIRPVFSLCRRWRCVGGLGWGFSELECRTWECASYVRRRYEWRRLVVGFPPAGGRHLEGIPELDSLLEEFMEGNPCFGLGEVQATDRGEQEAFMDVLGSAPWVGLRGRRLHFVEGGLVVARAGFGGVLYSSAAAMCTRPECRAARCLEWLEGGGRKAEIPYVPSLERWLDYWLPGPVMEVVKLLATNPDVHEFARRSPEAFQGLLATLGYEP